MVRSVLINALIGMHYTPPESYKWVEHIDALSVVNDMLFKI